MLGFTIYSVLILVLIFASIALGYCYANYIRLSPKFPDLDKLEKSKNKQRSVIRGQVAEHLAPIKIPYPLGDFRFIGNPIDYLVIAGTGAVNDAESEEISKIILLDIKTGNAQLSKVQRKIKEAVIAGKVYFASYNYDKEEYKEWNISSTSSRKKESPSTQNGTSLVVS